MNSAENVSDSVTKQKSPAVSDHDWRRTAEHLAECIWADQDEVRSETNLTDAWESVKIANGREIIEFAEKYAAALRSPPTEDADRVEVAGDSYHLTEYELQVLLGTTISGCNMPPDRVFSLPVAWGRLKAIGLIDRADGLAIATDKGRAVVRRILSAASPRPETVGVSDAITRLAAKLEECASIMGSSADRWHQGEHFAYRNAASLARAALSPQEGE